MFLWGLIKEEDIEPDGRVQNSVRHRAEMALYHERQYTPTAYSEPTTETIGVIRVTPTTSSANFLENEPVHTSTHPPVHTSTHPQMQTLVVSGPCSTTFDDPPHSSTNSMMGKFQTENDDMCCVCMTNRRTYAASPCFHFCVCSECKDRLLQCPICRSSSSTWQRIWC